MGGTNQFASFDIGFAAGAGGSVNVTGGQLAVTNGATVVGRLGSAQMTVSNGTLTVSSLVVTNNINGSVIDTNLFTLSAGMVNSAGAAVTNASLFQVGDGADAATYHLLGGVHSFANNLEIRNNATLSGCGTINGNVAVDVGGTVSADCGGTLTFTGIVTNNGTITAIGNTTLGFLGNVFNTGTIVATNGSAQFLGGVTGSGTILTNSIVTAQDIGLRIYDGTSNITIAAEVGTLTSALRIAKGGTNYGVILVDTNSANASRIRIRTSAGIKSLEKLP